jgi:hypothetical protein
MMSSVVFFFFLVAPFNGKKRRMMIARCLHIVVIFGFVVTQLCSKEDDDVRFLALSFFWL